MTPAYPRGVVAGRTRSVHARGVSGGTVDGHDVAVAIARDAGADRGHRPRLRQLLPDPRVAAVYAVAGRRGREHRGRRDRGLPRRDASPCRRTVPALTARFGVGPVLVAGLLAMGLPAPFYVLDDSVGLDQRAVGGPRRRVRRPDRPRRDPGRRRSPRPSAAGSRSGSTGWRSPSRTWSPSPPASRSCSTATSAGLSWLAASPVLGVAPGAAAGAVRGAAAGPRSGGLRPGRGARPRWRRRWCCSS